MFRATLLVAAFGFAFSACDCGGHRPDPADSGAPDASAEVDASIEVDASVPVDAGSSADADLDAGGEVGADAGDAADAGGNADASGSDAQTGALPVINRFTATPSQVVAKNRSTLTWATLRADTLSIDQGVGALGADEGSIDVFPTVETTYQLTAKNGFGTVTATATVRMTAPVVIFDNQPFNQTLASGMVADGISATATGGTKPYTVNLLRAGSSGPVMTWTATTSGSFYYVAPPVHHPADDGAQYHFEIADSAVPANANTSEVATITVLPSPVPTSVGDLKHARSRHTATLLESGKVLLAGGMLDTTNGGTAELYDPLAKSFTLTTHEMGTPRFSHRAIRLPSGKVLLAGGQNWPSSGALQSTELYDPASDAFTPGPSLSIARSWGHSLTLLTTGPRAGQVLVVGGESTGTYSTFEVYDPAQNLIVKTGSLASTTYRRAGHAAVELGDGKVLLAGGQTASGTGLDSAEIFDSATDSSTFTASLPNPAFDPRAAMLPTSKVFLLGSGQNPTSTNGFPYVFDPATGEWSVITPDTAGRHPLYSYYSYFDRIREHTLDVLPTGPLAGWVMVVGGSRGAATDIAYVFDTVHNLGYPLPRMAARRANHTSTLLSDGTVIVAGGEYGGYLKTAELFQ